MATSLEGFSATSHEKRVPRAPSKAIKRARGAALEIKVAMSKKGPLFVFCFLTLGGRCLQMFSSFLSRIWDTQNLPHFRAFATSIRELSSPECLLFIWQTRDCQSSRFCPPTCTKLGAHHTLEEGKKAPTPHSQFYPETWEPNFEKKRSRSEKALRRAIVQ